jgi:prenyltransferase beta subunit
VSVRLDMLAAVRRSLGRLGETSALVGDYVRAQVAPEGGFCGRSSQSDLYYTVFGLELLQALDAPLPTAAAQYLLGFGLGENLDLVHLSCLIRARTGAGLPASDVETDHLAARLESYRSADGGYDPMAGSATGSAYGCFLVTAAYNDLDREPPSKDGLLACLATLRAGDGGYGNLPHQAEGLTPTTAAAATLLRSLGAESPPGLVEWLLAMRHPESGFFAVPGAPIPDLLSTATALHALSCSGVALDPLREPCIDFVRSLWNGEGAFAGSWADPTPDCEYTYYGLLALGHLVE